MSRRSTTVNEQQLVEEGEVAGDYLEQFLDILDFDGDIDLDVESDRAAVSIEGGEDLDRLVGDDGTVLEALQELTRLAVQQELGDRSFLMLDIAGWRSAKKERLTEVGRLAARDVLEFGEDKELEAMSPFERKIVHDAIGEVGGVWSDSVGAEPNRRVVVKRGSEFDEVATNPTDS